MSWIGLVALVLALGAMAVDHLLGESDDADSYALDYAAFAISAVLCVLAAALLFWWAVPRARRAGPERTARDGLVGSIVSIVPGVAFVRLGFPVVLAGAAVELGLDGRQGARRGRATVAVVLGAALIAFATAYYAAAAIGQLS